MRFQPKHVRQAAFWSTQQIRPIKPNTRINQRGLMQLQRPL
jgi:hypothetical protein